MKLRAAVLVLLLGALAAAPAAAQPAASAPPSGTLDQAFAKAQADIQAVVAAINQALAQLNTDMTVLQAQIGNANKVLNTVSPAGTMVPGTATQIVDSTGAVWSFGPVAGADGNVILRNGVAQQGTQANLLYYDASGTVWQRNAHNLWWHWVNAAGQWQPNGGTLTSPIPAPPSNPPPSQSGNPPPPPPASPTSTGRSIRTSPSTSATAPTARRTRSMPASGTSLTARPRTWCRTPPTAS